MLVSTASDLAMLFGVDSNSIASALTPKSDPLSSCAKGLDFERFSHVNYVA
jgi:hypothetical protein